MNRATSVSVAYILVLTAACGYHDQQHVSGILPHKANLPESDSIVVESRQLIADRARACREGVAKATADRGRGIIGYYFWGPGIPSYADTLEQKYGMTIYRQGCSYEENWSCYNRYMDSVLLAVYKVNLVAREQRRAQLAFRKH